MERVTTKKHSKHAKINRRKGGLFHRHEIALIGAPCGIIDRHIYSIAAELDTARVGYVDADHKATDIPAEVLTTQLTDKINFEQYNLQPSEDKNHWGPIFNSCDLVLVNGNHFKADQQIVILHSRKRESLSRKLDRLTNVIGFIQEEEGLEIYDFLKDALPNWKDLPVFSSTSAGPIAERIRTLTATPPVHGLVLNGGKSQRMGRDKGSIEYHGRPQREHLAELLSQFCDYTAISVREDKELDSPYPLIQDEFLGLGPLSGLLTAFKQSPDTAWLTVACDQPALDAKVIQQLLEERDPSRLATCFHNPDTNFPEPLLTIWEPRAYPVLLQFLARGYSCPRKVLINSDVKEIEVSDHSFMLNVNTPEEFEAFLAQQAASS